MAAKLGLPGLLGPAGPDRDLALALIISRVVAPASKLSTLAWWADTTLAADLGTGEAPTGDVYAAMDWLAPARTRSRPGSPAGTWPRRPTRRGWRCSTCPARWLEGPHCPLAARGYSRDGKKGRLQIEYGLLTDPAGRPVAVRVFHGNTGDPTAFTEIVRVVRDEFGLQKMVMVGDRGMITSARIEALNKLRTGPRSRTYGWITALRAPAIRSSMADDGPLQLSLFDEQDLAEITSRRLPRRAAGRLPQPASWPPSAPASARTCWPPPRSCSPRSSPASRRPARRRRDDRHRGRQGHQQVQDGQALRRHHHR